MIEKIQIMSGDFIESLEGMSYESVGRLFMGLMAYANDKDPKIHLGENIPALTLYPVLKTHIERQEQFRAGKSVNGRKGGAPVGNNNASKTTKNNQKQPKSTKNNQKQAPIPIPNPIPNPLNNKRQYGECANVYLTDEEYEKVKSEGLTGLIDELSYYIAAKGDKYKSHYAVIRQWANRRKKETKVIPMSGENAKNSFNRFSQRSDNDYDYTKLIKN